MKWILAAVIGALLMPSMASAQNACGMILGGTPIFCYTFDTAKDPSVQSRTGALDPNVWGVSRTSGWVNFGSMANTWVPTALVGCNDTTTVTPPNDIVICNGQLREASNDNPSGLFDGGGVQVLAMYPKQPFDFAGRTGTVSFDVSNDSTGTHSAWPEFWFSNLPVPAPFNHFDSWQALPQHGFGIRFGNAAPAGQVGLCPNGNNLDKNRWTVDSAVVVRNYVMDDTNGFGRTNMDMQILDCVILATGPSQMNHIELRISQNLIDIYATDAGVVASPTTLRKIATVTNANLTATRGLIWLEDVHYNADKGANNANPHWAVSQKQHTFAWDNVAFDGPFTYRDFSYDALDENTPNNSFPPGVAFDLGVFTYQTPSIWNVLGMPANPQAEAVRVLFNFWHRDPITGLNVTVNGHSHAVPWPYPSTDTLTNTWRTHAVTIPITDLVAGTNVVEISPANSALIVSNVNIVLVNVPGGVPVLPGSNNAYPTGGTADTTPPTVPTNLQAAAISPSAVTLTWTASTDNVGVVGYKIFRGGAQIATSPGSPFSDSSLTAATLYTYNVAAYDAAGNTSSQSVPASATTQPSPPKTCTFTIPPLTFPQGQTNFSIPTTVTGSCQQ